ncbi:MAG: hypothetical protein J6I83_04745 [Firmicutes bacterium]|nr:hypothetical protein [Bacillota bacterium]
MRIREILEEELRTEKKLLNETLKQLKKAPVKVLKVARSKKGYEYFYFRDKPGTPLRYIRASEDSVLRKVTYGRFLSERKKILENNIRSIEAALEIFGEYDIDAIKKNLPNVYQRAIDRLKACTDGDMKKVVIQSENPKNPENLRIECSNGLMVRSKSEMTICEMLLRYGIEFRYEMALEVSVIKVNGDGTAIMEKKTIYPDFTIFLPDGSVIYWEHFGMLDITTYRNEFKEKIPLYYDNGIYPPKNLIITTEGPGNRFDNLGVKRIVEGCILPLMQ